MVPAGRWTRRLAVAGWLALSCAAAVQADWLITKGRTRIETQGTWEIREARVVFTDTSGRLVALPTVLIDLEASRLATEAARVTPTPTAVAATPTPLAVMTDAAAARVAEAGDAASQGHRDGGDEVPDVTFYSASWCGWCRKTRALLTELGVAYSERDIDKDPNARSEMLRLTGGALGVPVLDIGGTVVRGYSPDRIKALLVPQAAQTSPDGPGQ